MRFRDSLEEVGRDGSTNMYLTLSELSAMEHGLHGHTPPRPHIEFFFNRQRLRIIEEAGQFGELLDSVDDRLTFDLVAQGMGNALIREMEETSGETWELEVWGMTMVHTALFGNALGRAVARISYDLAHPMEYLAEIQRYGSTLDDIDTTNLDQAFADIDQIEAMRVADDRNHLEVMQAMKTEIFGWLQV